jgi:hypothetical protein
MRLASALIVIEFAALILGFGNATAADSMGGQMKQFVYIEASIGRAWSLDQFPKRMGVGDLAIKFIPVYDFDKSEAVAKALGADNAKPAFVVIQECSTYFPGPLDEYKKLFRSWILQIKRAGVRPVIATTVPSAAPSGIFGTAKEWIKLRILGRESQYDQIRHFNDWLRQTAREEGIPVLDLEVSLRRSESDRSMDATYDAGDGTHLNGRAYQLLDGVLMQFVRDIR